MTSSQSTNVPQEPRPDRRRLLGLLLLGLLAGCGKKGNLELPPKESTDKEAK